MTAFEHNGSFYSLVFDRTGLAKRSGTNRKKSLVFSWGTYFAGGSVKKLFIVSLTVLLTAGTSMAQNGVKKMRPSPRDFGRVIINNYSERGQLAPVVFDHWFHRALYTCSLCHTDLGFAMRANETEIKAADNINGNYCGACHNGKMTYRGAKIFGACSVKSNKEDTQECSRCHSLGKNVIKKYDFASFTGNFPKQRFGNGVDWVEAEREGLITLAGSLEGVPAKKGHMANPTDSVIVSNASRMPSIIFSHDKHSAWNGCELCHPDVFPSVKKGAATIYSMNEIFEGKYCGVCHVKVSFPMTECKRCHSKPVDNK
jgi:c(7)-type cytochrome triheme protein